MNGSAMSAKDDLPNFNDPPVIETVLGVFFRPIRNLNSVWQGIFWNECLKSELPEFELRPPVEEVSERFDKETVPSGQVFRWEVADALETPRLWAKSSTGERILQIQRNAVLTNWLRHKDSKEYRRFPDRLQELDRHFHHFLEFINRHKLNDEQPLTPTSCSVTYINHIPADSWSSALEKTLKCWNGKASDDWLPAVEQGRLQFSFAFPEQRGRLHVTTSPVVQREAKQLMLQIELTARLTLARDQITYRDVVRAIETGHDWIVRGFTSLTTQEMHEVWKRIT